MERLLGDWNESRLVKMVAAISALCAAFAASPAVASILDANMYDGRKHAVALTLSTAGWTLVFRRFLWKRSVMHFLWLGPLLGALNAGTTLSLSAILTGQGAGEAVGGLITGSIFGVLIGGGPLGFVFGAGLAFYIGHAKSVMEEHVPGVVTPNADGPSQSAPEPSAAERPPALRILMSSTVLLSAAAAVSTFLQTRPGADVAWPLVALLLLASGMALFTLITHARAFHWVRRLRTGRIAGARLRRIPQKNGAPLSLIVARDRGVEEGAFRTPENEYVLGSVPRGLGAALTQGAAATVVVAVAWIALGSFS